MKTKSLDIILALALVFIVVSGFAYTWQTTDPSNPAAYLVGMSADGRVICAVGSATRPHISTNSGQTWTVLTDTNFGTGDGIAISADGAKIFIALAHDTSQISVYVSSDHGTTFVPTGFPNEGFGSNYLVACSADGTKVIAASGSLPILYSTNGGMNCYTSSAPNVIWNSLASSADGRQMVASAGTKVYFSEDFGATWAQTNLPSVFWNAVCVSGDGKWVGATANFNSYLSNDSGVTWRIIPIGGTAISCSADGTNWLIGGSSVYFRNIYTSTNTGTTWQTNNISGYWTLGVMSADGGEIALSASIAPILLGRQTMYPQLNILNQSTNVALSWILPSTNFVLQQTADLANPVWTPVATVPTLNFTNLNQEVAVPANGSNTFFRLSAQ